MRTIYILIMLLLCLIFPSVSEAQVLDQKVSVEYTNQSIEDLLKDLENKYQLQFSYSNNLIPVKEKVSLSAKNKTLRYVLNEIFKNTDISYEQIGSHIVLKKNNHKKPIKSSTHSNVVSEESKVASREPSITKEQKTEYIKEKKEVSEDAILVAVDTTIYFPEAVYETPNLSDSLDEKSLRKKYVSDRRRLKQQYYRKLDSMNLADGNPSKSRLKSEFKRIMVDLKTRANEFKTHVSEGLDRSSDSSTTTLQADDISPILNINDSLSTERMDSLTKEKNKPIADTSKYIYRPIQISFITPIGTNGVESPKVVNGISLNLLGGVSAGLEGAEVAGLVNIEKDYAWGIQFAGLGNLVKNDVRGGQFSGLANINGGNTQGVQIAGLMNVVSENSFAVQGAGLLNVVSGTCKGTQLAGFSNITGGKVQGTQVAGFLNVAANEIEGAQIAGFLNTAGKDIDGIQIAGFMNVSCDTIEGVQVAGFLNTAVVVKGSQIGIINVADTVSGIQLGLFSYSRKGYRRLELWGSETLYGNLAFKTGTSRLHNIYSASARLEGSDIYWSYGLGLGTEFNLSKRLILNLDLLASHLHKNGYTYNELNLLNQFKLNLGVLITKKASIFAGPAFNVLVSNHFNAESNSYGFDIAPEYAFYNETVEKINVAMWVGFSAGVRF